MDISTLGIAVDSRDVAKATDALNKMADAGAKAETTTGKIGATTKQAAQAGQQLSDAHVSAFQKAKDAADKHLQTLRDELATMGKNRAEVEAYKAAQAGLNAEHQKAAALIGAQIDAIRNVAPAVNVAQVAMGAFGATVGAAMAVAPVLAFSRAMFDASAQAERIRTTLDFATGGKGVTEWAYVREEANKLGLSLQETAKAYAGFQAASRGTALEGDKARAIFEATAKASSVMGLSAADTSGVLLALQQMLSKGTVQAEELRGQLSERLPGGFQIAARAMGVTTQELGKMLEQGQVLSSDFLPKFAAQLDKELGGAAENAANRLDASVNRFDNAFQRLKQSVGDAGVAKAYGSFLDRMSTGFDNLALSIEGMTKSKSLSEWWYAAMYNAEGLAKEIVTVQKQLDEARNQLDKAPSNIYFKSAVADAQEYLAKLLQAKAAQDELRNGGPAATTGDAARADRKADALAAQAEAERLQTIQSNMAKVTGKLSGIKESFYKDLNALYAGFTAKLISLEDYRAAVAKLIENDATEKDKNKGARAAAERDAVNAEIEEVKRGQMIKEELARRSIAALAVLRQTGEMDEVAYLRAVAAIDLQRMADADKALQKEIDSAEKKKNSRKEVEALEGQLALNQEKRLTREQQLQNDITVALYARETANKQLYNTAENQAAKELLTMQERNKATRDEIEAIGMTAEQVQRLTERRMDYAIQMKANNIEDMKAFAITQDQIAAMDVEIAKLNEMREARTLYTLKTSYAADAKATETAYSNAWQSIDKTAHDTFVNVMTNGQDAFTAIGKTIKSAIIDMLYQLTIKKWLISIGVSMFGSGFAQAAGSDTGAATAASSIFNTGRLVTNGAANLYSTGANLFSKGLETLGSSMMDMGNWMSSNSGLLENFGDGLGYANAAIQAFKGNWGAAAGSAIGAALGGPIGSMVGNWLGGLVDKAFAGETRTGGQYGVAYDGQITNQRRGETYMYEGQKYNEAGPQTTRLTSGQAYLQEAGGLGTEGDKAITKAVAGTAKAIDDTLSALGSQMRTTGYWAGLETSSKGRGGVFAGGTLTGGVGFGSTGKGDNYAGTLYDTNFTTSPDAATAAANFALDLKMSYVKALQAAGDIPDTIKNMLKDSEGKLIDVGKMSADEIDALIKTIGGQIEMVQSLNAFADALPLESLKKLSFDAASGLIKLAGGLDSLTSKLNSYYQNYYSADEQQTQRLANLKKSFAAVGLTLGDVGTDVDTAKARFRALLEAQDTSTEAGRKAYMMLLDTQQAYLDAATYAANAAKAAKDAAEAKAKAEAEAAAKAAQDALTAAQAAADKDLQVLQAAIDKQKTVLQGQIDALTTAASVATEQINTINTLFDTISKNVDELYGQVTSTAAMQLAEARAFITNAVKTAATTGYLPDNAELSAAINTVRGSDNYRTTYEAERARLTLAAQLNALGQTASSQKSVAQQQLDAANTQIDALKKQQTALDDLYKKAQEQIAAANGTTVAVKSVDDAVSALNTTVKALAAAYNKANGITDGTSGGGSGGTSGGGSGGTSGGGSLFVVGGGNVTPVVKYYTGPTVRSEVVQDNSALVDALSKVSSLLASIDKTTAANYYIMRAVTQKGVAISTTPATL